MTTARGYILLPVVLVVVLLAALSMLIGTDSAMGVRSEASKRHAAAAEYVAEAGLAHTQWQLANGGSCDNYAGLPETPFAAGSYATTVTPGSGSPVAIASTGTLAGGAMRALSLAEVRVYDAASAQVIQTVIDADGEDTFIESESGHQDRNNGDDKELNTSSKTDKLRRALLRFDLSRVPAGVRVQSATLSLYQKHHGTTDVVHAHRLLRDWTEAGVTWNAYDGSNAWDTPGGDYAATAGGSFLADANGPKSADVTELVRDWVERSRPNYGLILLSEPSSGGKENKYHSGDKDGEPQPTLFVTFSCECGVACFSGGSGLPVVLSTANPATIGVLDFDDEDLASFDPVPQSASLYFDGGAAGLGKSIDAVHVRADGRIVLSTDGNATLGGLSFDRSDLVEYDPAGGTATLLFDGSLHFAKSNENVVAVHVLGNGHLVMATESAATLAGFDFSDRDLVEFDPSSGNASLYFDGDATTLSKGIAALHLLENGHFVLGVAGDTALGGVSFGKDDLVEYDPATDTATSYFSGAWLFADGNESITAAHVLGDAGPVTSAACDADYTPTVKVGDFSTAAYGSGEINGLTYYPEGTAFNSVDAPAAGAWISVDNGVDKAFMTDMSGTLLTSVSIPLGEPTGIAFVEGGDKAGYLAVTDRLTSAVFWLDNNGTLVSTQSNAALGLPVGVTYLGETAGGAFDESLAFMSVVNWSSWKVLITDQDANVLKTLDVTAFVNNPDDIAHLPGSDKLLILSRDSHDVITIDFDGNELSRYSLHPFAAWSPHGLAINPQSCVHVVADPPSDKVMSLGN